MTAFPYATSSAVDHQRRPYCKVEVYLRNALDKATHAAVLQALVDAYPGKTLSNFVWSFLSNRTFEIRSGRSDAKQVIYKSGVPQGAILSITLLNLVMTKVVHGVAVVPGINVTGYADDVTIWTETTDHATTETAVSCLQRALNTFT